MLPAFLRQLTACSNRCRAWFRISERPWIVQSNKRHADESEPMCSRPAKKNLEMIGDASLAFTRPISEPDKKARRRGRKLRAAGGIAGQGRSAGSLRA